MAPDSLGYSESVVMSTMIANHQPTCVFCPGRARRT